MCRKYRDRMMPIKSRRKKASKYPADEPCEIGLQVESDLKYQLDALNCSVILTANNKYIKNVDRY
jgi:hypothetical protein